MWTILGETESDEDSRGTARAGRGGAGPAADRVVAEVAPLEPRAPPDRAAESQPRAACPKSSEPRKLERKKA